MSLVKDDSRPFCYTRYMDEEAEYGAEDVTYDTRFSMSEETPSPSRSNWVALGQIALCIAAGYLFGWAISILAERFLPNPS